MTAPYNPIAMMQQELADRLAADAYFADITVLTERTADIQNTIDRALKVATLKGGKIGAAVVVGLFSGDVERDGVPGPEFSNAALRIQVTEHVLFNSGANGTGKAAVDVSARVAQLLHHYRPTGLGETILITGSDAVQPVPPNQLETGTIAYQVRVGLSLTPAVLEKVAIPGISVAGVGLPKTVTLTCATSGAAIYYTTDYSYPSAVNTEATLYAAPFEISAACLLRVVAHKSGLAASDCAAAEFAAA